MKLTNTQLIYICQQIEKGSAANALATADLYLSKNCPIRKALAKKAAPYLSANEAKENPKDESRDTESTFAKNNKAKPKRKRFKVPSNPNLKIREKFGNRRNHPEKQLILRTYKFTGKKPSKNWRIEGLN